MQNLELPFAEVRLYHNDIIEGTHGGPEFSTDVTINSGGFEQRNANWSIPLGRWELGQRGYCKKTIDYLNAFFWHRRGKYQGFRFRDLADFSATATLLQSEDLFSTQGLIVPTANPLIGQLIKRYSDGIFVADRVITKPVAGTVTGLPSGCTVNLNTGAVNSASPITEDVPVSFEFDVPVRFDVDKLDINWESVQGDVKDEEFEAIYQVGSLPVVELRMPSALSP